MSLLSLKSMVSFFKTPVGYTSLALYYIFFIGLALFIEKLDDIQSLLHYIDYTRILIILMVGAVLFRMLFKSVDHWFALCVGILMFLAFADFRNTANHFYLGVWLLFPLAFFPKFFASESYSGYVRKTLGVVMLAAGFQKLISGNFLNGDYLQYMASGGDKNEAVLRVLCFGSDPFDCDMIVAMSIGSVVWQLAIGLILLLNYRHVAIIAMEIFFVLFVGYVADEMNFQTINVAAIMIAYRVSTTPLLFLFLASLLIIDQFRIHYILEVLLS